MLSLLGIPFSFGMPLEELYGGAELLWVPATQTGQILCSSEEKSGIVVGRVRRRQRECGGPARLGITEEGEVTGQLPMGVRQISLMSVLHQLASGQQGSHRF